MSTPHKARSSAALRRILRAFVPSRFLSSADRPLQIDLAYATTEELVRELQNRSESMVLIHVPLHAPDQWLLDAGGHDPAQIRSSTLVGLCRVAERHLLKLMRSRK